MKKILSIFSIVVLGIVSCSKGLESSPEIVEKGLAEMKTFITASISEGNETKTEIGSSDETCADIVWSEGDEIMVLSGPNFLTKNKFTLQSGAGTKNGVFASEAEVTGEVVAVYPYSESIESTNMGDQYLGDRTSISMILPRVQTYKENSFSPGSVPMSAKGTIGSDLKFVYIMSVLGVKLHGDFNVSQIVVGSKARMCGPCSFWCDKPEGMHLTFYNDTTYYVTMNMPEPVNVNEEKTFYIAVPSGTYDFYVNVIETKFKVFHKIYTNKTFTMGKIKSNATALECVENGSAYFDYYNDPYYLSEGYNVNGIIWAPENCGYEAPREGKKGFIYGKMYQWGRKVGLGYWEDDDDDEVYNDPSRPLVSQDSWYGEAGRERGDTFYADDGDATNFYKDWIKDGSHWFWRKYNDSYEFSELNPEKGEFDPCPPGWRVPTRAEMENLVHELDYVFPGGGHLWSEYYFFCKKATDLSLKCTGFLRTNGEAMARTDVKYIYNRDFGAYYWTSTKYDPGEMRGGSWDCGAYIFEGTFTMHEEDTEFVPVLSIIDKYRSMACAVRCVAE